jgi:hypothetical protein
MPHREDHLGFLMSDLILNGIHVNNFGLAILEFLGG